MAVSITGSSIFLSSKHVEARQLAEARKIIKNRELSAEKKNLADSAITSKNNNNIKIVKARTGTINDAIPKAGVVDSKVSLTTAHDDNPKRFRALVDLFLVDHPVTDIVCTSKGGAIKIDRDVFISNSTISHSPHIIIEKITENSVVFCDPEGHKYEKTIDSLME